MDTIVGRTDVQRRPPHKQYMLVNTKIYAGARHVHTVVDVFGTSLLFAKYFRLMDVFNTCTLIVRPIVDLGDLKYHPPDLLALKL